MPKIRFPIRDMAGLSPAIDARNEQKTFLLKATNVLWDSKGVKSGFGSRLVSGTSDIEDTDGVVQSLRAGRREYIFTSRGVYYLAPDSTWVQVLDLAPLGGVKVDPWRRKWTVAYLQNKTYFAHYHYGLFKLVGKLLVARSQDDIPGIPFGPVSVGESNGRLVILGKKYIGWSGPGNPEDFAPSLGGAGFQLISDRVAGRAIAMTTFQSGFTIWTENEGLTGEFIGGDLVWRFEKINSDLIPLNAWALTNLAEGSTLIVCKQGIFVTANGSIPKSASQIFNEYFRAAIKHEDFLQVRIDYFLEWDILFVQLRDWTNHYVRTFVLSLALDRFGMFSERHLGIHRYGPKRGQFGYTDIEGVVSKFVEFSMVREDTPGVFLPLESYVEIGYVKPDELRVQYTEIDTLMEMQEINIGSHPHLPTWAEYTVVDMGDVVPNESGPVCAPYEFLADWTVGGTNGAGTFMLNDSAIKNVDAFDGYDPADRNGNQGFRIWAARESRPILAFAGQYYDMSDWELEELCGSIYANNNGIEPFWYYVVPSVDFCLSLQVKFATNIDECVTRIQLFCVYFTLDNYRSRTVVRYSSKNGVCRLPPELENIGSLYMDAFVCGVTLFFDMTIPDGNYGPIFHMRSEEHDEFLLLESVGGDFRTLRVTSSFGLALETSIAGETTRHKFALTINRATSSVVGEYALSQDGGIAVTQELPLDYINPLILDPATLSAVGWNQDTDATFGNNAYLLRMSVKSALEPGALDELTSI